jgi:hypothetical protein
LLLLLLLLSLHLILPLLLPTTMFQTLFMQVTIRFTVRVRREVVLPVVTAVKDTSLMAVVSILSFRRRITPSQLTIVIGGGRSDFVA